MTERTHYEVLGLSRDASAEDVKKAYRRIARVAHPDVGGSAALFGMVGEAYRVLSNALLRREYDETLGAPPRPEPTPAPEPEPGPVPEPPRARRTAASDARPAGGPRAAAGRPGSSRPPRAPSPPPRDVDAALDALGLAAFARTLGVVAAAAAVGVLLRVTGLVAAVLGVGVGERTPLGGYHPVPTGVSWGAAWPVLATVAVGLLIAATSGWQRRVLRGRVHPAEPVVAALWLTLVLASGELLLVRPAVAAAVVGTAAGYATFVAIRTRGRRPAPQRGGSRRRAGRLRWPLGRPARGTTGR